MNSKKANGILFLTMMNNKQYLRYSSRQVITPVEGVGIAKIGVAVGIGVISFATGGLGGIAIGMGLGAFEAMGGIDSFYNLFSDNPNLKSLSNPKINP